MKKYNILNRAIVCFLVLVFSFSSIAASSNTVTEDKQELYNLAVKELEKTTYPRTGVNMYKDKIEAGLEQVLHVVDLFEELEGSIDVTDKLQFAYGRLGDYYMYLSQPSLAEQYYAKANDSDPDIEQKIQRAKSLSNLECHVTAFICNAECERIRELESPNVLYLGDLKENQCFELSLIITNKGEPLKVETSLEINGVGFWAWEPLNLGKGDSCAISVWSNDEPLKTSFLAGDHSCIWTIYGYPVVWFEYIVKEGTAKAQEQESVKPSAGSKTYQSSSSTTQGSSITDSNRTGANLKDLYDEFNKYWVVTDQDDVQDRFEEFLKTKNIDPDSLDDYDDFMEAWTENYDEDLDYDDIDYYIWNENDSYETDPDEYDILLDDDIDDLYDDYLDDYIDEEYYYDYGEYFDEVYSDW